MRMQNQRRVMQLGLCHDPQETVLAHNLDEDDLHLDVGEVLSGAHARPAGKGRERVGRLLGWREVFPPLRPHFVGVVAPDLRVRHGHGPGRLHHGAPGHEHTVEDDVFDGLAVDSCA